MHYTNQYFEDLEKIQSCIPNIEQIKNKKILVTGAGGLIGSTIVDFLIHLNQSKEYKIEIYVGARNKRKLEERFGKYLYDDNVTFVQYDALVPINLKQNIDYIIHAASPANPMLYVKNPVETMLANFIGIKYILEYAKDNHVNRVLYISSSEIYGKKKENTPYLENDYGFIDLLNPRACYPSSKRAAETLCVSYLKEYGVKSVIVRPGHIYGGAITKEDNRASSQFLKDVAMGKDIIMKSIGSQKRSYCYVCDGVSSIFTVLLNGIPGQGYNISNPNSVCTIKEMAECIAAIGNQKILFEFPTEKEKNSYNLMDNSSIDSSSLIALGWKGLFDLKTGLCHSLEMIK